MFMKRRLACSAYIFHDMDGPYRSTHEIDMSFLSCSEMSQFSRTITAFFSCSASSRVIQSSDSLNTVDVNDDAGVEVHVSNGVASGITTTLSAGDHQSMGGQNQKVYNKVITVKSLICIVITVIVRKSNICG